MKFKKAAALVCAAICAMTTVVFANQSISELGVVLNDAKNANANIPEGAGIVVSKINVDTPEATKQFARDTFKESEELPLEKIDKIGEGLNKVNDPKVKNADDISPAKFLKDYLGVPADATTMKCTNSDREVVLDNLHLLAAFKSIGISLDGGNTVQALDNDGNEIATDVVMALDQIRSTDDLKGTVIMVIDPKTGEPKLIDLEVVPVDTETMDLTVPFPCFGPFGLMLEGSAAA